MSCPECANALIKQSESLQDYANALLHISHLKAALDMAFFSRFGRTCGGPEPCSLITFDGLKRTMYNAYHWKPEGS